MSLTLPPRLQVSREEAIARGKSLGLPILPVAPAQDAQKYPARQKDGSIKLDKDGQPIPAFTGKNPSYLDRASNPNLVRHEKYQSKLPTSNEQKMWFACPTNGIGTLGGWEGIYWLDLDAKRFESQEDCDRALEKIFDSHPKLRESWIERTHSGGWHVAFKLKQKPDFTNFALAPGGEHVGEVLGEGRFCVLAPTIGKSGNPYKTVHYAPPVEVESLESIGIYPTKVRGDRQHQIKPLKPTPQNNSASQCPIYLEDLGTDTSRAILNGENPTGDRSEALTTAVREWYGWENWTNSQGITINGSVENLAYSAGERLGIDQDRIKRILKTIEPNECRPAALYQGGEESCWLKIRKLNREVYREKCPTAVQQNIKKQPTVDEGSGGEGKLSSNEWNAPVSWQGEIGCWKKGEEGDRYFLPQCNFDFQVVRELESEDGGGLEIAVKRSFDRNERTVFIESTAYTSADKFVDALKRAMGTGVVCNLNKYQLNALIHTRTQDYRARGGKTYRLAERRGCQPDGTWVFEKKQFKPDGTPTTTEESGWVYTKNFPKSEDYIPEPVIEDHNSDALKRYVLAKQRALGANFAQSLLMDGWVVSVLHDAKVLAHESTFPLFCLHGDAGSFKSVIAECSVGLAGFANSDGAILSDASESLLFERLKYAGSLPILWDDPKKTIEAEIDEMSKKVFNRFPRSVRGNIQHPQGGLAYTANWVIGEKHAPTRSRFISVFLPVVKGGTSDDFYELRQARREVNRCFPDLLKLGYPYAKVKALEQELTQHLPQAHSRTSRNLAIILHYAMEVVRLSEVEFDIKQWVITNLTPQLNESHSGLDSVTDFAEKLETLKARSLVGEWNFVEVRTREHGDCVALHLPSIWTDLEKEFKPAYNRSVLEKVLIQRGAFKGVAKFWEDRDLTLAYKRRLVTGGSAGENADQPQEPDKLARKCLLIPKDVWDNFYNPYDFEPQVEEGESYQEQVTSPLTQVTSSNLKLGNCSNQVTATLSDIEDNPSNQVTTSEGAKPSPIGAKQEAEQQPKPGDRIVIKLPGTTLDGKGGVFRGAAPDPQGLLIADILLDDFYQNRRQWSGPVAWLLPDQGGKQSDS
jgi:hypothetical protein